MGEVRTCLESLVFTRTPGEGSARGLGLPGRPSVSTDPAAEVGVGVGGAPRRRDLRSSVTDCVLVILETFCT